MMIAIAKIVECIMIVSKLYDIETRSCHCCITFISLNHDLGNLLLQRVLMLSSEYSHVVVFEEMFHTNVNPTMSGTNVGEIHVLHEELN